MSKEKLTIEHLAPYLPYGVKVLVDNGNCKYTDIITGIGIIDDMVFLDKTGDWYYDDVNYFTAKLVLRPISDLQNEIEHNGEKFVPLKVLNEYMPLFGDVYEIYIDDNSDVRLLANYQKGVDVIRGFAPKNMLMKWHFDVFGLLDKNLAINLNEVK